MPYRYVQLAGYSSNGKPWVSKELKGKDRARVMEHQKVYIAERKKGTSYSEAIRKARNEEHKGLSRTEIQVYEGKLGAKARGVRQ